jgi:hypothetical protein
MADQDLKKASKSKLSADANPTPPSSSKKLQAKEPSIQKMVSKGKTETPPESEASQMKKLATSMSQSSKTTKKKGLN